MAHWIKRRGLWRPGQGVAAPPFRSVWRSIRVDGSGKGLRRRYDHTGLSGTALPDRDDGIGGNSYTFCAWVYLHSIRTETWQYLLNVESSFVEASAYHALGFTNEASPRFNVSTSNGYHYFGANPPTGQWVFVAITTTPYEENDALTDFAAYWRIATDDGFPSAHKISVTQDLESILYPVHFVVGNDSYDEWCDVSIGPVRVWDATLSETELLTESQSPTRAVRTSGLYSSIQCNSFAQSATQDHRSGLNNHFYEWTNDASTDVSDWSSYTVGQLFTWSDYGESQPSDSVSPSGSASPSSSASPSASESLSVSPSASISPSVSASPSVAPLDAICWGYATPDASEEAVTWQRWQVSAGVIATVDGDADWGKIHVPIGGSVSSPVTDTGNANSKTFTAQKDKYGTGGSVTLSVRGSATSFAMFDGSPTWEEYTAPITRSWRYVQVKMEA